jgi:hypothetical protein
VSRPAISRQAATPLWSTTGLDLARQPVPASSRPLQANDRGTVTVGRLSRPDDRAARGRPWRPVVADHGRLAPVASPAGAQPAGAHWRPERRRSRSLARARKSAPRGPWRPERGWVAVGRPPEVSSAGAPWRPQRGPLRSVARHGNQLSGRTWRPTGRPTALGRRPWPHEVDTKAAHSRDEILASVTSGTPGCPWGRLGTLSGWAGSVQ